MLLMRFVLGYSKAIDTNQHQPSIQTDLASPDVR